MKNKKQANLPNECFKVPNEKFLKSFRPTGI